jgi:hypothetical protein
MIDNHTKFGLLLAALTVMFICCNNTKKSGPVVVLRSEPPEWSVFYAELDGARRYNDSAFQYVKKQIKKQKPRRIRLVQEHADGIIPAIDY